MVDEAPTASAAADRRERIIDTIAASPPTAARPAASPPSGPSATFFLNHGGESPIFVELAPPSLATDEPGEVEDVASAEMVRLRDAWHVLCLRLSREAHGRALVRRAARQHDVSAQRIALQHWLSVQRLDLEERIAATIRDLAANELAAM